MPSKPKRAIEVLEGTYAFAGFHWAAIRTTFDDGSSVITGTMDGAVPALLSTDPADPRFKAEFNQPMRDPDASGARG